MPVIAGSNPASLVPGCIKRVALLHEMHDHGSHAEGLYSYRDPRGALACLRRSAAGQGTGGSAGARPEADPDTAGDCGIGVFGEIEAIPLIEGLAGLEYRNGAEHDVRFDSASGRVIKLTLPGEFGAWGGLEEYVQRMVWVNEFFDDDWHIEGWVQYPNENAPRLVTSQPWYRVDPANPEPTLKEIDAYMWKVGFLKSYEGAWIHAEREIVASDAVPKNFVVDVAGFVQPIDVILLAPGADQWERLQNMARSLPQE